MKTWHVEARLRNDNGTKITIKVQADTAEEARYEAGRRLIEAGFAYRDEPNAVKIVNID